MPATLRSKSSKSRRRSARVAALVKKKRGNKPGLELDADEVALHAAISTAVARDLGR